MRALADLDVLIVDCQATGASPAFGCVLELGWAVQRAGDEPVAGASAHWIALPEGHRVPPQVRKITGYDPRFAAEAITDAEAWSRLRRDSDAAGAMPTAIHYARFELAFLREWAARFEPEAPFPFDIVCVHAIARRLFPDLPRQSIRALAGYLGFSLDLERRSLGHVEATAFVWRKLRNELVSRGVETWEHVPLFLKERSAEPRPRATKKPRYPLATERYRALPDQPGVYRFLRSNGDVLYVGKAASLKRRVASHFTGKGSNAQSPEMLTQVGDIAVTVVESALEAALLENETIKALRPPYNVQLTVKELPVWYGTRAFDAASTLPDETHPLGPLPSEFSLRPLAALVALAGGADATDVLRSHAVGVSALFTPDSAVFAAGWCELLERHPDLKAEAVAPRRRVLNLARRLLVAGVAPEPENGAAAVPDAAEMRTWDAPRVARHVERALVQAYRAYRRAHWLALLHDSDVIYREPGTERMRLLEVRGGEIVAARDLAAEHAPSERLRPALLAWRTSFDRAKYERLRVLTTELKRILRDGGSVSLCWGPARRLPERWLPGALGSS